MGSQSRKPTKRDKLSQQGDHPKTPSSLSGDGKVVTANQQSPLGVQVGGGGCWLFHGGETQVCEGITVLNTMNDKEILTFQIAYILQVYLTAQKFYLHEKNKNEIQ